MATMVSPFGDMLEFYANNNITDWIWHHMDAAARHGLLYSDKDTFLMARPVNSKIPVDDLNALLDLSSDYEKSELTYDHDTWHIMYASGRINYFFDKAPYVLPNVMWQRNGKGASKIHSYNKVKKRIHGE
jgi:hypothetical protein